MPSSRRERGHCSRCVAMRSSRYSMERRTPACACPASRKWSTAFETSLQSNAVDFACPQRKIAKAGPTDHLMNPTLSFIAGIVLLTTTEVAAASDSSVVIKGSNTFGEELGPLLIARYSTVEPTMTFILESQGSSSGIAALLAGKCDVAASSRTLTEDERRLAKVGHLKLNTYVIGYYGVAVIVNAQNPVHNLSTT